MENQVKKPALKRFQRYVYRLKELMSSSYRNQRIQQAATMRAMKRISEIKERHPELIRYLDEMPEFSFDANDSQIKLEDLRGYNNSLLQLLEKYEHESSKNSEPIYFLV